MPSRCKHSQGKHSQGKHSQGKHSQGKHSQGRHSLRAGDTSGNKCRRRRATGRVPAGVCRM
jgi:hypothetical protein